MGKIIFLLGLPGSGKSTWAKEQVKLGGVTRVNKDDLRAMLHNGQHTKDNEKLVLSIQDNIIIKALRKGDDVIVDNTHLNPEHLDRIKDVAEHQGQIDGTTYEVEIRPFTTPLSECIENDLRRPNPVGKKVIMRMYYDQYLPMMKVEQDVTKPEAVIFDLDGTLALMGKRSPYNPQPHEIAYDKLDSEVEAILRVKQEKGYKIIICSGRNGKYLAETDAWLKKHGIQPDLFLMRKEGDDRKDHIVKREMFMQHILPDYYVTLALDDRNRIVDTWREMGIKTFQVEHGYF